VSEEFIYRVVEIRKKTVSNPKYTWYRANDTSPKEPRYLVTDETYELVSKPYKTLGSAKGARTRQASYSTDNLISASIQKAQLIWQDLAEDEL
jgi:hypothetical protein